VVPAFSWKAVQRLPRSTASAGGARRWCQRFLGRRAGGAAGGAQVVRAGGASVFLEGGTTASQIACKRAGSARSRRPERPHPRRTDRQRAGGARKWCRKWCPQVVPQVVPAFSWKVFLEGGTTASQIACKRAGSARSRRPERPHPRRTDRQRAVDGHDQGGGSPDLPSVADTGQSLLLVACRAGWSAAWHLGLVRPFR